MATLPPEFLTIPIAHRGLHGPGVPENSLAAARAAITAGFAIELDIQPAADGKPMVFHDYSLTRVAGGNDTIASLDQATLATKRLLGSDETIPSFKQFLELVAGKVPLLIEIKDQDGALGPDIGELHKRVADDLRSYTGAAAVMSFNPHTVRAFHNLSPDIPVGITSCDFPVDDWPLVSAAERQRLASIADFEQSGSCFISHDKGDLSNPRVTALKVQGIPILCWTIRTDEEAIRARRVANNITFEGYTPER